MGLVVDAQVERMHIEGFRVGSEAADKETWFLWQANGLDDHFAQALVEAAKLGRAYLLIGPNPRDRSVPIVSVEHPAQAIVEHVPGSRRERAAGLKVWRDDWTGRTMATLWLPDAIYRLSAPASSTGATPRWEIDGDSEPNPLGEVPLVELPNNPDLLHGGRSEIEDLTDIQDRINKTIADRLITQDFGAFPQKWATAYPEKDESGNVNEIDIGRDRLVTTDVAETRFGQWDAAPLDPYSMAKREDVKDVASRSRTPAQYLLGELNNVNGETLRASESGLVAKVRQRCRGIDNGVEEGMRLARRLAGIATPDDVMMETIWRNPEFRTEGELVDALVKMRKIGLPLDAVWERWGASPQERDRWREQLAVEASDPVLERLAQDLNDVASQVGT